VSPGKGTTALLRCIVPREEDEFKGDFFFSYFSAVRLAISAANSAANSAGKAAANFAGADCGQKEKEFTRA